MHRSRIAYFTIDVDDLDAAVTFWSSALGAVVEPGGPTSYHIYRKLCVPDADIRVLLQRTDDVKDSKNRMHLDLETDDVDAEVRRLEALGALFETLLSGVTSRVTAHLRKPHDTPQQVINKERPSWNN